MHTSSGAINFICDSHPSRYNFETLEGMLRSVPKYRQSKARVRGSSWLIIFKIPWACQKFSFQLSELPVDFFVRKFGSVRCVFEPYKDHTPRFY